VPAVEHEPDFAERASKFGEKMRFRAHQLNLSQKDVIDGTGLSRSYVQLLWNGRGGHRRQDGTYQAPNPTMDIITRLSIILKVDDGYLIDHQRSVGDHKDR
jgi:transcriptional regulator with XRE-family HTH domain